MLSGCGVGSGQGRMEEKTDLGVIGERVEMGEVDEGGEMTIRIGEEELVVEVVQTPEATAKGLGYREEMGTEGMLFVMEREGIPTFWMKGMRFGLDMVWIRCLNVGIVKSDLGECLVVDVTEKVPTPEDSEKPKEVYSPRFVVTHVLEVPYGWVEGFEN